MDPLSITVASLSLAKICGTVGFELAQLIQEGGNIGVAITALQTDVNSFETVLNLLHDTVNNADVKSWLDGQAQLGSYWGNVAASLEDARITLQALSDVVTKINKPKKMLDTVRKQVRLKFVADEIVIYRQQISRFKDTVQVVLNTTTIWHQVSDKEVSEKVVPRLDETQDMIRKLGMQLNARMAALQAETQTQIQALSITTENLSQSGGAPDTVSSVQIIEKTEYKTLTNMRECLKGAASVISSASTTAGRRVVGDVSTVYDSDFGDVFPSTPNDRTLAWIESNTIPEFDEGYATKSEASHGRILFSESEVPSSVDDFDFDPELELEILQACYKRGVRHSADGEHELAEPLLKDCIEGLRRLEGCPHNIAQEVFYLTANVTSRLIHTLKSLRKLEELPKLFKHMMQMHALVPNANPRDELAWRGNLAFVLYECKEYEEVLLHCRPLEAELRKLGSEGLQDRIKILNLTVYTYRNIGREREADRCQVLIEHLESSSKSKNNEIVFPATDRARKILAHREAAPLSRITDAPSDIERPVTPIRLKLPGSSGLDQRVSQSGHSHAAKSPVSEQRASGLTYKTSDGKTVKLIAVTRRKAGLLDDDRFAMYLPNAAHCELGEELQVLRFTSDKLWIVARRHTGYEGQIELKDVYLRSVVVEESGTSRLVLSRSHSREPIPRGGEAQIGTEESRRRPMPPTQNTVEASRLADIPPDEITDTFEKFLGTIDKTTAKFIRSIGLRHLKKGERSIEKMRVASMGPGSHWLRHERHDEVEVLLRTDNPIDLWFGRQGDKVGLIRAGRTSPLDRKDCY